MPACLCLVLLLATSGFLDPETLWQWPQSLGGMKTPWFRTLVHPTSWPALGLGFPCNLEMLPRPATASAIWNETKHQSML